MNLDVTDSILQELQSSVCMTSGIASSESGKDEHENLSALVQSYKTGKFGGISNFEFLFFQVMSSIYTVSIFYQLMYDEKSHLFIRSTTTPPVRNDFF